ncbi:hypothetical protein E05_05290 [Plautia stali symbiont]|nr:hypothetical protein E05_05290 [Plautia stali symbiont]
MSNVKTILITGSDLAAEAVELLQDYQLIYAGRQPQEADLIALCERHNPQAIIVRYGKINGRIMDAAPALCVISKHGSGIDVIDQQAAAERQIAVRAAVGANAAAVSEHAWALILAYAKSVPQLDRRMRDGHWDKAQHKSLELEGRTLGLVVWVPSAAAWRASVRPSICRCWPTIPMRKPCRLAVKRLNHWMSCTAVPMWCRCTVR